MKRFVRCAALVFAVAAFCVSPVARAVGPARGFKEEVTQARLSAPARGPVDLDQLGGAFASPARVWQAKRALAGVSREDPRLLEWTRSHSGLRAYEEGGSRVLTDGRRGVVAVQAAAGRALAEPVAGEDPVRTAIRYLEANPGLFGLKDPASELREKSRKRDHLGMEHLRLQQTHRGLPFWGREVLAHFDARGRLESVNGLLEPTPGKAPARTFVDADRAIEIAWEEQGLAGPPAEALDALEFLDLEAAKASLFCWQREPMAPVHLAWVVETRAGIVDWRRCFVDAVSGDVLEAYDAAPYTGPATAQATDQLGNTVTINVYEIDGVYFMVDGSKPMFVAGQSSDNLRNDPKGALVSLDIRNQDLSNQTAIYHFTSNNNTWTDPVGVSCQYHLGLIYDFYKNLPNYARDSFDDRGSTVLTLCHVTDNGQSMANAYWNGKVIVMGDGGSRYYPLVGCLDVMAHEFTHAVVQYTANLEYRFQSGALNETYADIGGVSVDDEDFLLAENGARPEIFPTGCLRNMGDPHNGGSSINDASWQPAHMSEYLDLTLEQDNGGVHINGGITNFAAYKIMNAVGRDKGEQILYRALATYLTQQSNFADFRIAAVKAATDLYGAASAEETAAKTAFDDVGIVEASAPTQPPDDTPVVAGTQYILAVSEVDDQGYADHSLFLSNGFNTPDQLAGFNLLTATQVNVQSGRPVAVDTYGQAILFVDSDYNLRQIGVDGSGEEVLLSDGQWWSVAISPSGRYVALTRNVAENILYVLDLAQNPPAATQYALFHPTTDHDNSYADVVKFADALTFADDRKLVYDCLNAVQSPTEGELLFYDVNLLDLDAGRIFAILPPQQSGVSIGNPTFASTNQDVLGLDVYVPDVGFSAQAVNLRSGDVGVLVQGLADATFPDYAVDDSYVLVSAWNGSFYDMYAVPVAADKISAGGDPQGIVQGARNAIWFAQGTPPTATVAFSAASFSGAENVAGVGIYVSLSEAASAEVTVDYAVTGGNAIPGQDYTLAAGRLAFAPGETMKTINATIIDDAEIEADETFTVTLSRAVNAWMGDQQTHTYTIIDNDSASPTPTAPPASTPTPTPPAGSTPTPTPPPGSTPTPTPGACSGIDCVIEHFYSEILGRTPGQGEKDAWHYGYFDWMVAQNVDVRFVPSEMGRQFFLAAEYVNRQTDDTTFITDNYNAFLYRDPSAGEISGWVPVQSRKEAISIFSRSEEFQNRVVGMFPEMAGDATRNFVATMYLGLLDRLPDPGGLAYYADQFSATWDKRGRAKQMGTEVTGSQEYAEKINTTALRVESMYRAYLGRYPNNSELTYWSGQLTSGAQALSDLINAFADSQEFTNRLNEYFGG